MIKCFKKYLSTTSTTNYTIPYYLGGLKMNQNNLNKTFESGEEFLNYIDENNIEKDKNIFSFFQTKLKISKEFENILSEKYYQFTEGLVYLHNEKIKLKEDLFDVNFYNKLILENEKRKSLQNNSLFKLIKDSKNKNKIYLDKIFLHYNVNKLNRKSSNLINIENIFSKNLFIFYYGRDNNNSLNSKEHLQKFNFNLIEMLSSENYKNKKSLLVRLSVWIKVADNIIIEHNKNLDQNNPEIKKLMEYKIYDDEWHHMLLEFEDSLENLNYLEILKYNSFPRIISYLINRNKKEFLRDKIKLKISDFDFHMKGNPISEGEESLCKNELYYIRNKF